MIGICDKCKRECRIYNPNQKIKLCISCYNQKHRDYDNVLENNRKWQKKNLEYWRKYIPNTEDYKIKHIYVNGSNKYKKKVKPLN